MGLGNGLTFAPGLAIMSSHFDRHRAVAVGIAAAGAATGGMIYPVLVDQLLYTQQIGFGWTVRAAGLVMLITQIPGLFLYKPRFKARASGPWIDWSAFKEAPFVFFTLSMFLNFWGLYFAFFFLGNFARDRIGVHKYYAFRLDIERRWGRWTDCAQHFGRSIDRQTQYPRPSQSFCCHSHIYLDSRGLYRWAIRLHCCLWFGWRSCPVHSSLQPRAL